MNFTRCKFKPKSASSIQLAYPAGLSVAVGNLLVFVFLSTEDLGGFFEFNPPSRRPTSYDLSLN